MQARSLSARGDRPGGYRRARRRGVLFLTAMLLGALAHGQAVLVAPVNAADAGCTFTIPTSVLKVDGNGNFSAVRPGDTLCLPAGTRANIKLLNLRGTADAPITVRNSGGVARITGTRFTGGIVIDGSAHVRLSGTGVSTSCGASVGSGAQACGIEMDGTKHGVLILTHGDVHHFEIDHVYVHDTSTAVNSRGVGIHPNLGQLIRGIHVHDTWIVATHGEGMYLGSEPHGLDVDTVGKVSDVHVAHNLVERTGYDGIKVKVGVSNVAVHHNIVRDPARRRAAKHDSGIQLAMSVGSVYNNVVLGGLKAVQTGRPLTNPGTSFFNNLVVDGETSCMDIAESDPAIYNNTLVRCGTVGIRANGASARVFDNILAGTTGTPIVARASSATNNLVTSIAGAGFVNAGAGDYHLGPSSPAIDAGRSSGLFPPFDLDGVARPQGDVTDQGAYERRAGT